MILKLYTNYIADLMYLVRNDVSKLHICVSSQTFMNTKEFTIVELLEN